ncbi:hypothetical protein C7293_21635 [filamentous cyanobacterium CCT1]|nr:hypothetical protein C7293_21635 [filamentous cyanobacterium CCT1]
MFEPNDNPETSSLPLPPNSGSSKGTRPLTPEKVRHMLYGSLAGIDRTIKILHALGYADPNDWSEPIPAPPSAETRSSSGVELPAVSGVVGAASPEGTLWMAILTKTVLIE